jgi:hypothetical protein
LKAYHVALQRAAAGNPVSSLKELDPDFDLCRLTTAGYPAIINKLDAFGYNQLKKGDPIELKY